MRLPKTYVAQDYEKNIYKLWDDSGIFIAQPKSDKPHFSISMPPPNETGNLHIGHALFITLQDILSRQARQKGMDVLWLPGTDHAALATNAIIERKLAEQGTNKHEVGRDKFLEITREFVGNSRSTIISQLKAMGASCDWTRLRYTLDESLNRCVKETFVKMYNDGLIYRGNRIVNWDPVLETNVSEDEVDYVEEKGKFYYLKYGPFVIGTARPETKFGDKYVVMHPKDKRYLKYKHGDTFKADWINGEVTATVIKDGLVDPKFGTGVMTITPWHDQTDFIIAEKHKLDKQQIIDFHGKLLSIAGEFAGLQIDEARPKIVAKLDKKGLLVKTDDNYLHSVAVNSRGKAKIEPQIRLQWFVDVNKKVVNWEGKKQSLKQVMQSVIREGDIKLIPKRFEKNYFNWVDNLRDWCISRQIWWGHRIPVWYRSDTDGRQETYVGVLPPTDESEGWNEWEQDPDTLDTWFSSALWTWSTLVDPKLAEDYSLTIDDLLKLSLDFQTYHPTSVMETGWDILLFWVTKMILATTYMTGEIPFKTVFMHGLIRTEEGTKMSKSRPETIIDPLEVIPEYGTDALRLALIQGMSAGNDKRLGRTKIIANRNFCNKLWNIARYIDSLEKTNARVELKTSADHYIISRLSDTQKNIINFIDNFSFSEAYEELYKFIWHDLADWYIEVSKSEPNAALLNYVLDNSLIIAHPFAPFVSEAIWQSSDTKDLLASQQFNKIIDSDRQLAAQFNNLKQLITEVRNLIKVFDSKNTNLYYSQSSLIKENSRLIKRLSGVKDVINGKSDGILLTSIKEKAWLDVDLKDINKYITKLDNNIVDINATIKQMSSRLKNKNYLNKAPKQLVAQTKTQLSEAKDKSRLLSAEKDRFKRH